MFRLPENYKLEKNPNNSLSVRFENPIGGYSKWHDSIESCLRYVYISVINHREVNNSNLFLKEIFPNLYVKEMGHDGKELGLEYVIYEIGKQDYIRYFDNLQSAVEYIIKYIEFSKTIDHLNNGGYVNIKEDKVSL